MVLLMCHLLAIRIFGFVSKYIIFFCKIYAIFLQKYHKKKKST